MSWRQTLAVTVGVALIAAFVVWWLEGYNRARLIQDFQAQLGKLPEFRKER